MLVCLMAAALAVSAQNPPELPVTRLSGDKSAQTPTQKPTQPATKVPGLPVTRLDDRGRSADLDSPQRLTMLFAEPTNVRDVLLLLVRGTPLSIAVDPAIKGTFVGELKDVTLRRAIESVLAPNGLAYSVDGSVIRIFARRPETRLYDLNFLNVERTLQRSMKTDEETSLTSRVPGKDALDEASAGIQTLLSDAGRVHIDRRAGLAQVTDYADRLDRVGAYVEALQIRGSRQVRLQARVLEITLKGRSSIDWRAVRSRLGIPENSLSAGAVVDPATLESLLGAQGDVEVIAAPEFLALNNEPAVVRASVADASALTLTVVPQISADGIVMLSLSPSWTIRSAAGSADTVVRVMDGATVMVSGFVGAMKEVVVLLTPTVVNAAAGLAAAR
jgi:MSHA biogenesis protein MshL